MAHTLVGIVSSDKRDKTITVSIENRETHPLYRKQYTKTRKYTAHDEKNEAHLGDKVEIVITYKTETEAIPYDTKTEPTDELPKGETSVVQKGVNGEKETVYEIKTDLDGKQVSKTVISEKVLKTPVTEIVKVGTKEVPPATEPPTGFQD